MTATGGAPGPGLLVVSINEPLKVRPVSKVSGTVLCRLLQQRVQVAGRRLLLRRLHPGRTDAGSFPWVSLYNLLVGHYAYVRVPIGRRSADRL